MNKIKHIAIAISALSAMGAVSLSLASECPTSISPGTAACLSRNADANFQQNYNNDYRKQQYGGGSSYYPGESASNSNVSSSYSAPNNQVNQATQAPSQPSYSNTNNDNDNTATHKPIRWY